MIVVDTGPIVAATFRDDKNHERCVQELTRFATLADHSSSPASWPARAAT